STSAATAQALAATWATTSPTTPTTTTRWKTARDVDPLRPSQALTRTTATNPTSPSSPRHERTPHEAVHLSHRLDRTHQGALRALQRERDQVPSRSHQPRQDQGPSSALRRPPRLRGPTQRPRTRSLGSRVPA